MSLACSNEIHNKEVVFPLQVYSCSVYVGIQKDLLKEINVY